jgi:hypothetical protein
MGMTPAPDTATTLIRIVHHAGDPHELETSGMPEFAAEQIQPMPMAISGRKKKATLCQ